MAGERDYLIEARLLARAEAIQFRSILLGFGLVDQWMKAVRDPAPAGPQFHYNPETRRDIERQDREWLRSARPTDSDWGLAHAAPEERSR